MLVEILPHVWINPEMIVRVHYASVGDGPEKTTHSLMITMIKGDDLKFEKLDVIKMIASALAIKDPTVPGPSPSGLAAAGASDSTPTP